MVDGVMFACGCIILNRPVNKGETMTVSRLEVECPKCLAQKSV
jgi:hypothetical protein